jgi:excisionase family DNA binding protein
MTAAACTPTGWAAPDQMASRVDLLRTLKCLHLSMVGGVDIAHVAREVAETHITLTAPRRVIAMRARERPNRIGARHHPYDGKSWASARQIATNQVIPLPEPARCGLVNLINDVIAACNRAVAAAAPLDPSESAQLKRSGAPPALRRSGQSRMAPRREPAPKGSEMSRNHSRRSGAQESRDLDPKWYTVAQVASLLGYGETKVRMLIISGDLRSLKDGHSRRVLPEWVDDYVRLRASQAKDMWD